MGLNTFHISVLLKKPLEWVHIYIGVDFFSPREIKEKIVVK